MMNYLLILAEKLIKPFLKQMETIYSSRVEAGEFRELQPEIVVRLIGSIMIGMTLLKNIEGDTSPLYRLPQEKIADEIWNFILRSNENKKQEFEKRRGNDGHGDQH